MDKKDFNDIIEHQVAILLSEMGLSLGDLNNLEYLEYKYEMALKLLLEP